MIICTDSYTMCNNDDNNNNNGSTKQLYGLWKYFYVSTCRIDKR